MSNPETNTGEYVAYELTWHTSGKALLLTFSGNYTLEAANEVNQLITDELNQSQSSLLLLIDAAAMNPPYNFQQIRATQTYMDHQKLKLILVAANDKLVRLAMVIIFSLSRARFQQFDDVEKANRALQRYILNLE